MKRAVLRAGAGVLLLMLMGAAAGAAAIQVTVNADQPIRAVNPSNYGSQIEGKMEYDSKIADFLDWSGLKFMRLWGASSADFLWDEPREVVHSRYPCIGPPPDGDWNQSVWGDTDDTFDWFNAVGWPGSRVMITVPAARTTPARIAAWVDHVNNVRGEGVVYWVIGCETWGSWDCSHQTPEDYAALVNTYGAAMKTVDPSIKIVASVGGAYYDISSNWDRTVVNLAGDTIDALCYHWYPGMQMDYSSPADAALWVTGNVLALKPLVVDRYQQIIAEEAPDRVGEIEIGIGEMDGAADAPSSDLSPYEQNIVQWGVGDMLFWAAYLGEAQKEGIAFTCQYNFQECPFGLIRGWAVEGGWGGNPWDEATIRGKAYAMKLYSEHFRGTVVETSVTGSDTFYKPLQWREETWEGDVPYVAAYSALDPSGNLCVMVINRHPTESRTATITINGHVVGSTATLYDLGGTASGILAQNDSTYGNPSGEIQITQSTIAATNPFTYEFPAHSCTAVVFSGPPMVLLEVHPDERAQGPGGGPKIGTAPWQPSGLGPGSLYQWKAYQFDGGADLWIQVSAQCFSASQNAVGQADRLKMEIDGQVPLDVWGIMSGTPSYQWDGNIDTGNRMTLEFQPSGLSAGLHTLKFWADETPVLWWVKVCGTREAGPQ